MVYEHRLYLPVVGPIVLFSLLVIRGVEKLKNKIAGAMNHAPATM